MAARRGGASRAKKRKLKNKAQKKSPLRSADYLVRRNFEKFLPRNCNSPVKRKDENSGNDIQLIAQVFGVVCNEQPMGKENSEREFRALAGVEDENLDEICQAMDASNKRPRAVKKTSKKQDDGDNDIKRQEGETLLGFQKRMKGLRDKISRTRILSDGQRLKRERRAQVKKDQRDSAREAANAEKNTNSIINRLDVPKFGDVVLRPPSDLLKIGEKMKQKREGKFLRVKAAHKAIFT